ncbi:MAG: hypothetical protein KGK08_14985, partial [Acidobacteriota bacterium]|nr:hypothetical protein [Acidobacteriota bacterium]
WAAIGDHGVYAIFGVGPLPDNPSVGIVWLLAHEEFPRHRKEILTTSKPYAEEMGKGFKWLMNVIDARHVTNLRWLKWVGFTFDHTFPEYGVAKIPFIRFVKEV